MANNSFVDVEGNQVSEGFYIDSFSGLPAYISGNIRLIVDNASVVEMESCFGQYSLTAEEFSRFKRITNPAFYVGKHREALDFVESKLVKLSKLQSP